MLQRLKQGLRRGCRAFREQLREEGLSRRQAWVACAQLAFIVLGTLTVVAAVVIFVVFLLSGEDLDFD